MKAVIFTDRLVKGLSQVTRIVSTKNPRLACALPRQYLIRYTFDTILEGMAASGRWPLASFTLLCFVVLFVTFCVESRPAAHIVQF